MALLLALGVGVGFAIAYAPLRADDAYIVGRYARNIVAGHGWVFNAGEQVNALTSPLHLALLLPLQEVFTEAVTVYRLLAAAACAAVITALAVRRWSPDWRSASFATLVLASPFVAFWSVGGLETPLLAALCALLAFMWLAPPDDREERRACAIVVCGTLAVFTRYDAVLFAGPVVVAACAGGAGSRAVRITAAGCALAFGAWLAFTHVQFGDVLPTSFHVKAGRMPGAGEFGLGLLYVASFVVLSWVWTSPVLARADPHPARETRRSALPIIVGLALTFAYALFASTKHMMYLYRLLVPFLPVIALLAIDRAAAIDDRRAATWVAGVLLLQVGLGTFIYFFSQNPSLALLAEGRSETGERFEFSHVGARHTADFLGAVERQAPTIAAHWARHGTTERPPRIMVSTGGLLPYLLPSAYTLEKLVSYRHRCNVEIEPLADYVQVIYRSADAAGVLAERERRGRTLIAQEVLRIDGLIARPDDLYVELWYRRSLRENPLPARMGDACRP